MKDPFEYLLNYLKTDIFPSPIHGIGTRALVDMNPGDSVFDRWKGDTRVYTLTHDEFNELPNTSKQMILKSYENKEEYPVIWFRLYKDCYWNLANPWAFTNTNDKNNKANIDSHNRVVIRPIKAGEELIGTYDLEKTILK